MIQTGLHDSPQIREVNPTAYATPGMLVRIGTERWLMTFVHGATPEGGSEAVDTPGVMVPPLRPHRRYKRYQPASKGGREAFLIPLPSLIATEADTQERQVAQMFQASGEITSSCEPASVPAG